MIIPLADRQYYCPKDKTAAHLYFFNELEKDTMNDYLWVVHISLRRHLERICVIYIMIKMKCNNCAQLVVDHTPTLFDHNETSKTNGHRFWLH